MVVFTISSGRDADKTKEITNSRYNHTLRDKQQEQRRHSPTPKQVAIMATKNASDKEEEEEKSAKEPMTDSGAEAKKDKKEASTPETPAKTEEDKKEDGASSDADDEIDSGDVESDDGKEEEAMFQAMEKEQAEKTDDAEQPTDVKAAPKMLQQALAEGKVDVSDSEKEEEAEKLKTKADGNEDTKDNDKDKANGAADKKASPSKDHHVHARANQLDFLLSKASEYSNFISKDLEELQSDMQMQARKKMEKAEKRKRKSRGTANSNKRAKKANGSAKELRSAISKDNESRSEDAAPPIFIQPPNLAEGCQLKDYQLEGVRWLASLFENGVSGILADEMGLGKTIQVIGLIAHLLTQGVSGPFFVVAPLATLPNWVREIQKWLPDQPVVRYHGPAKERAEMLNGPLNAKMKRDKKFPIIVTSYEVAIRDKNKLQKLTPLTYMIVDEGHRLKNHRCLLLSSLKHLKAGNRLLLTGTPIQNTLDELWSLLNFVNPQIFDDLAVFQSWFGFKDIGQKERGGTDEGDIMLEQRKNNTVTKLHEILRPFLLRRVKLDVLKEMPPKKEIIVYSGMSKLQIGYAQLIEKGNLVLRDELIRQGIEAGRNLSKFNKTMNFRKNVNHPFLFGEPMDPATGALIGTKHPHLLVRASGKFALMDRMLQRLFDDGHQVLIFSQMTAILNILEDYLVYRNWKYCRIDGSTNIDDRQTAMDKFNAEKTKGKDGKHNTANDRQFVFLLSTRAGGLGINLTSADTCIIFDSDWNPHADSQAMDRCHRLGQTRPVAVYRLLTCNSVDIHMMERQVSKKKLERMTIAGGDFRKAGMRSQGDMSFQKLESLLQSDIADLQTRGQDVEDIRIDDDEFERIMNRSTLFGDDPIATEGKMYDIIDSAGGDLLGAMTT